MLASPELELRQGEMSKMSSEKGDIVFEITDDPEVVRFTHLQNGASWSTEFLTREEYADRERLLGMSQLGQLNKSREHMEQYKHCLLYTSRCV